MAQVRMRSSSARTAGEVQCGLVGSCHTDRPSDTRRRLLLSGSRLTQQASTSSVTRSRVAAHSRPEASAGADARSQTARMTSARVQVDPTVDS
jgi:hypothetical protein